MCLLGYFYLRLGNDYFVNLYACEVLTLGLIWWNYYDVIDLF